MRIAIVTNLYPPYYRGGYEVHCAQLAEGLQQAGHQVRVLTSTYGLPASYLGNINAKQDCVNGVPVSRWLNQYYFEPQPKYDRPWFLWRARRELQDCGKFVRFVDEFKPDVINWWNMNGMTKLILPLPNQWGLPDIHAVDDLWLVQDYGPAGRQSAEFWHQFWDAQWGPGPLRSLLRPFLGAWERNVKEAGLPTRDLSHHPAQLCFLSEYLRRVHREWGIDVTLSRVIYGGVDKGRFFQQLPKGDQPGQVLRLLYAGQVTPDRGLMTVVEALAEMPQSARRRMTLTVAGNGPKEFLRTVTARIKEVGLEQCISLVGKVNHDRIPETFKAHDVFIFASKRPEGLGFVCIEAMLAGCAVITTGSGGSREIAEAADLPMFPAENARALSGLLIELEGRRERVSEIAARGQAAALRQFSSERMMEAWLHVFQEIVGDAASKRAKRSGRPSLSRASALCS